MKSIGLKFVFLFWGLYSSLVCLGQKTDYSFPLKPGKQHLLSGTMGELRSNHFHSGLDIKTGGVEGLPIYAIEDGYVERIKISPYGYGLALYIKHPNGHTSVYAHLRQFRDDIADYALRKQYARKRFAVELYPKKNEITVRKGEQIGNSGNSGSSMGPHLHFEIRDAAQRPLNPLDFDFTEVKDNIRPSILSYAFNCLSEDARVNNLFQDFVATPGFRSAGDYYENEVIAVHGSLGFAIKANDLLDGASNRNGINGLRVTLDGEETFSFENNRFAFSQTRYLNSHIDYKKYAQGKGRYIRCYVQPGNKLPFYSTDDNKGILTIRDSLVHDLEVEVWDSYGNKSHLRLKLKGTPPPLGVFNSYAQSDAPDLEKEISGNLLKLTVNMHPNFKEADLMFRDRKEHLVPAYFTLKKIVYLWDLRKGIPEKLLAGGLEIPLGIKQQVPPKASFTYYDPSSVVYFPANVLYDTMYLEMQRYNEVFTIGSRYTPLHKYISIKLKPEQVPQDLQHTHVYEIEPDGNKVFVGGTWESGRIEFRTRNFGQFTLATDTVGPTIVPVQVSGSQLRFNISDNLSGIDTFNAYVNGEWVLMKWRYQTGMIWSEKLDKSKPFSGSSG